jgi:serine/threonine protein phosphatase PrpC
MRFGLLDLNPAIQENWRPVDVELISSVCSSWRIFGASVIGPGHVKSGGVRQDAFSVEVVDDVVIAVVADGLSSASLSHVAATAATKHMAAHLANAVRDGSRLVNWRALEALAKTIGHELASGFEQSNQDLANYYTTILGVVVGGDRGFMFNVGDGALIAFRDANKSLLNDFVISEPEHGQYHGEVFPLLTHDFDVHFRIKRFGFADRIVLMTDGVTDFALSSDESSPQFEFMQAFDEVMTTTNDVDAAKELAEYLRGDRVSAINNDDKTIIWLGRIADDQS